MRVILTEDVLGVGDIGETIEVRGGFARNFLIPKGLALEANSRNAKQLQHTKRQIDRKKVKLVDAAEELAKQLRNLQVTTSLRVGRGGKVFGSIGAKDIAAKLAQQGIELDRRRVMLAEPIKRIGTHFVPVKLHPEVTAQLKVVVEALGATDAEQEAEIAQAREALEAASDDLDFEEADEMSSSEEAGV